MKIISVVDGKFRNLGEHEWIEIKNAYGMLKTYILRLSVGDEIVIPILEVNEKDMDKIDIDSDLEWEFGGLLKKSINGLEYYFVAAITTGASKRGQILIDEDEQEFNIKNFSAKIKKIKININTDKE